MESLHHRLVKVEKISPVGWSNAWAFPSFAASQWLETHINFIGIYLNEFDRWEMSAVVSSPPEVYENILILCIEKNASLLSFSEHHLLNGFMKLLEQSISSINDQLYWRRRTFWLSQWLIEIVQSFSSILIQRFYTTYMLDSIFKRTSASYKDYGI